MKFERLREPASRFCVSAIASTVLLLLALHSTRSKLAFSLHAAAEELAIDGIGTLFEAGSNPWIAQDRLHVPMTLRTSLDVFELAGAIDAVDLRARRGDAPVEVRLVGRLSRVSNADVTAGTVPVVLELPLDPRGVEGVYRLESGAGSAAMTIRASALPAAMMRALPTGAWGSIERLAGWILWACVVLNLVSVLLECRHPAGDRILRFRCAGLAAVFAVGRIFEPPYEWAWVLSACVLLSCPWILRRRGAEPAPETPPDPAPVRSRYADGVTVFTLAAFALMLTASWTFRWAIFEERDYLAARDVLRDPSLPVVGPQILVGGQTPGGFLYLMLAPAAAFGSPAAFAVLNRIFYLAAAVLLAGILRRRLGPPAAAWGAALFCGSWVVFAYAHWPIHPSFSVVFFLLFVWAGLRSWIDGRRGAAFVTGFVLALLMQLHFSYTALLPAVIALALLTPGASWRRLGGLALGFGVPFLPYAVAECLNGFDNTRLLLLQPRGHPIYVPMATGLERELMGRFFDWTAPSGRWSAAIGWLAPVLLGGGWFAVVARAREPFARAIALLAGIPFLILMLWGWGYAWRHALPFAPAAFLVMPYAVHAACERWSRLRVPAGAALLLMTLILAAGAFDRVQLRRHAADAGEWAVDYRLRDAAVERLIDRWGVTPEQYRRQVFWWWMGWSMSTELYEERYRPGAAPVLAAGDTLLVMDRPPGPYFESRFVLSELDRVGPLTMYRAVPRAPAAPFANTINPTRPSPLLTELERRDAPDGLVRLDPPPFGEEAYLLSLHEGRLRLAIGLWHEPDGRVRWRCESPHLNGYYQEIKQLWRPAFRVGDGVVPICGEPLGELMRKTPIEGEFVRPAGAPLSIEIAGSFDQSFMERPDLSARSWPLASAAGP